MERAPTLPYHAALAALAAQVPGLQVLPPTDQIPFGLSWGRCLSDREARMVQQFMREYWATP